MAILVPEAKQEKNCKLSEIPDAVMVVLSLAKFEVAENVAAE